MVPFSPVSSQLLPCPSSDPGAILFLTLDSVPDISSHWAFNCYPHGCLPAATNTQCVIASDASWLSLNPLLFLSLLLHSTRSVSRWKLPKDLIRLTSHGAVLVLPMNKILEPGCLMGHWTLSYPLGQIPSDQVTSLGQSVVAKLHNHGLQIMVELL